MIDRSALLKEIQTLQHELAARRASGRPMNSSLVAAYHQAIERCYSHLDEQPN